MTHDAIHCPTGTPTSTTTDAVARRVVSSSVSARIRRAFFHQLFRFLTGMQCVMVSMFKRLVRRRPIPLDGRHRMILTGRVFAENWAVAHLGPLAASSRCAGVIFVSTYPVPPIPNVKTVYPPAWLKKLIGRTPARLLVFMLMVLWQRPDIVGGFHMKVNALLAITLAPLIGARSLYFCVGGPPEVIDGGIWGEAKTFELMETRDELVESRLLSAAGSADLIITMGTRAMQFFRDRGVNAQIHVLPGGIDPIEFACPTTPPQIDVLLMGRLVEVKRIDVFLDAMRIVADEMPNVRTAIVGGGSRLHDQLHAQARDLHLENNVEFVGYTNDVANWLRKARLFVMTSDSEGLSLALMQATMTGLPAIVSNVGDLADLVEDGVNGYLVPRRSPREFARRIISLLRNEDLRRHLSAASRISALKFTVDRTIKRWDHILDQNKFTLVGDRIQTDSRWNEYYRGVHANETGRSELLVG